MFSEDVGNFLIQHFGLVPYLVLAFALFLLGPTMLLIAFSRLWVNGRRGGWDGLLLGFGMAAWASLCWLVVPYCGGYPCLPGLLILSVLGTGPVDALWKELVVHATNFLLWPIIGWSLFHIRTLRHPAASVPASDRPRD